MRRKCRTNVGSKIQRELQREFETGVDVFTYGRSRFKVWPIFLRIQHATPVKNWICRISSFQLICSRFAERVTHSLHRSFARVNFVRVLATSKNPVKIQWREDLAISKAKESVLPDLTILVNYADPAIAILALHSVRRQPSNCVRRFCRMDNLAHPLKSLSPIHFVENSTTKRTACVNRLDKKILPICSHVGSNRKLANAGIFPSGTFVRHVLTFTQNLHCSKPATALHIKRDRKNSREIIFAS